MIVLTQIFDMGSTTEDRAILVNPAHIMWVTAKPGADRECIVSMVDGWTFTVRHDLLEMSLGIMGARK
jgi:hypothetical protein